MDINKQLSESKEINQSLKDQILSYRETNLSLEDQNMDSEVQLAKLRGMVETLMIENEGMRAKLGDVGIVVPEGVAKNEGLQEPMTPKFDSEFQAEYFKLKEALNSFKLENRTLKSEVRQLKEQIDDLIEQGAGVEVLKCKLKA